MQALEESNDLLIQLSRWFLELYSVRMYILLHSLGHSFLLKSDNNSFLLSPPAAHYAYCPLHLHLQLNNICGTYCKSKYTGK